MLPNPIRLQIKKQTPLERGVLIEKVRSRFNSKNYKIVSLTENRVEIEGTNLRYNFEIFEEGVFKIESVNSGNLVNFSYIAVGADEVIFVGFIALITIIIAVYNKTLTPLLASLPFWLQGIYKFHIKKQTAKNTMEEIIRE